MNPRVEDRPLVTDCPRFQYTDHENCRLLYRMSVWCDDTIDVVGDPDNGGYEWIYRDKDGKIKRHSNCGYGMTACAMLDGLLAADLPGAADAIKDAQKHLKSMLDAQPSEDLADTHKRLARIVKTMS